MKILQISPQVPGKKSGGELGVLQTVLSLKESGYLIDYIGPEIKDQDVISLYNECYFLEYTNNVILRMINLLRGITNGRYLSWKELDLDFTKYDVVVLDFTKLDYIFKKIHSKNVIVKVHNVEYDYAKNDFNKNKGVTKLVIYLLAKKQEARVLKNVDAIMTLTENDKMRLLQIYGDGYIDKIYLNPVCINEKKQIVQQKNEELKMLITGSLWYGDNVNGAIWFIRNVYCKLQFKKKLVIAGARPNPELRKEVSMHKDIVLVDSPKDISPFFYECDIFIAPVFDGAGMKVKVAEALSYGKPVIGTSHAFIGYQIRDGYNSFVANKSEEFINKLTEISKMNQNEWNDIVEASKRLFKENYSISNSSKQWNEVITRLLKGKNHVE